MSREISLSLKVLIVVSAAVLVLGILIGFVLAQPWHAAVHLDSKPDPHSYTAPPSP